MDNNQKRILASLCKNGRRLIELKTIIDMINNQDNLYHLDGATEAEIAHAENELQLTFNKEYRDYLLEYGLISYNSHELTGICDFPRLNVVAVTMEQRQLNPHVPQNCYVIEQANVDGIAIWQSSDGWVFQSCPNTPLLQIADSLSDYIQKT